MSSRLKTEKQPHLTTSTGSGAATIQGINYHLLCANKTAVSTEDPSGVSETHPNSASVIKEMSMISGHALYLVYFNEIDL